ncbi:ATP-binding cassette domain-containing protein [Xinfangfangia sp. CPCC 101601]|uniref:ATP-binding cassette domain-containing protein n=1 Tax=Pseudogemmobacter lacusdianii TaxID=3069608 RepID=A0ABU0W3A5_9RHOB|nr:oligopeptide/dipeptide ABC transporter ATP-binding protein [Xinfangfangia sp. CPCC 101601]MDQ2067945.1 ATP-binding cassette domain-containing protein [Xinfangfangia sp. CPCC 101601]
MTAPLLSVRNLGRKFVQKPSAVAVAASLLTTGKRPVQKAVRAVNDISFDLGPGEALGLVGESGCGKSTVARLITGLITPDQGAITYKGETLAAMARKDRLKIQMVFQDPLGSLDPRMRLGDQIAEGVRVHNIVPAAELKDYLAGIFADCGIDPVLAQRYPHQVSGGQRQRFGIARALAMKPDLVICDEPVAALDVSIQAQVINLLARLRRERGLSYIFISHDLNVVRHLCDRVAVMYLGKLIEIGDAAEVLSDPRHPYTSALGDAAPRVTLDAQEFRAIKGEIPSPLNPPKGCFFNPRCSLATDLCRSEAPELRDLGARKVACHTPL